MSIQTPAGPLRHVVVLQKQVSTGPNAQGAPTNTWTVQYSGVRAEIRPLRGDQYFAAQQMASVVDVKVRIRYHSAVRPGWRVVWGSRVFIVVSVIDPEMRKIYLDLMSKEIFEGAA